MSAGAQKIVKVQCSTCSCETNHEVLHTTEPVRWESPDGDMWATDTYQLIMCRGCNAAALRHISVFSETLPDTTVRIYPPRSARKKPSWIEQLHAVSTALTELLEEVYVAVDGGAKRLTAMGVRAVFEHVMLEKVGDYGSFEANLNQFEAAKFISGAQKDIVGTVIDVGSATIHRGYLPSDADVDATLGVMETVVKTIYIDTPAIQRITLPPRPARKATAVKPASAAAVPAKVTSAPPPPRFLKS